MIGVNEALYEATEDNIKLEKENEELKNINDKLSSALKSAENKIDKAIEYINKKENMKIFNGAFGYGEFIGTLEEILKGNKQ